MPPPTDSSGRLVVVERTAPAPRWPARRTSASKIWLPMCMCSPTSSMAGDAAARSKAGCAAPGADARTRTSSRPGRSGRTRGCGPRCPGVSRIEHRRAPGGRRPRASRCGRSRRRSRRRSAPTPVVHGPARARSTDLLLPCRISAVAGTPAARAMWYSPPVDDVELHALLVGQPGHGPAEERLGGVGHATGPERRDRLAAPGGGGPRRRRTAACRTRRPARPGRSPPIDSRPGVGRPSAVSRAAGLARGSGVTSTPAR